MRAARTDARDAAHQTRRHGEPRSEPERVNEVDEDGNSALIWSVHHGRCDICQHLLSIKHVAVDLVNKLGHTALYDAASFGWPAHVHALAAHGADVGGHDIDVLLLEACVRDFAARGAACDPTDIQRLRFDCEAAKRERGIVRERFRHVRENQPWNL